MSFRVDWALERILELDQNSPGLAGVYLRASDERRHTIAAYLSVIGPTKFRADVEIGLLRSGTHKSILQAAFGAVPKGLRRSLARAGRETHDPRFYRYLHALLCGKDARRTREVLAFQPKLDLPLLRASRIIPEEIGTPALVTLHRSVEQARQTAHIFRLMCDNGVDRKALAQSLREATTKSELLRTWQRWVERLHFPPPPLPEDGSYTPIINAGELKRAALSYRNCMRGFLVDILEGRAAFATFSGSQQSVIVHLRRRADRWFFDGAHSRGNGRVDGATHSEGSSQRMKRVGVEPSQAICIKKSHIACKET
jgi:hypothetical protein